MAKTNRGNQAIQISPKKLHLTTENEFETLNMPVSDINNGINSW